jgi:hypothetical protein
LRATGLTWLAMFGDEPLSIRDAAGHANFATTEGYIRRGATRRDSASPSLHCRLRCSRRSQATGSRSRSRARKYPESLRPQRDLIRYRQAWRPEPRAPLLVLSNSLRDRPSEVQPNTGWRSQRAEWSPQNPKPCASPRGRVLAKQSRRWTALAARARWPVARSFAQNPSASGRRVQPTDSPRGRGSVGSDEPRPVSLARGPCHERNGAPSYR